jgi:Fe-Mn family superoxide dismutase
MPFVLPPLPYDYAALEPHIDARTMEIHYTKHHQAYVDNLNAALKPYPDLQKRTLDEIIELMTKSQIPQDISMQVRNNGGGHYNHSFFWPMMKKDGGGKPTGSLAKAITDTFGSFETFQEQFNAAAKKVFGSGWAWLVYKNGKLTVVSTPNQDPVQLQGYKPVIGLDVWEHAYYLKYQNKRPDYISAWWNVINWDQAQKNFDEVQEKA